MKVEIDLDVADDITLQSLVISHESMEEALRKYEDTSDDWIAMFHTNEKKDIKAIKKMKKALALVIGWYGGKV